MTLQSHMMALTFQQSVTSKDMQFMSSDVAQSSAVHWKRPLSKKQTSPLPTIFFLLQQKQFVVSLKLYCVSFLVQIQIQHHNSRTEITWRLSN